MNGESSTEVSIRPGSLAWWVAAAAIGAGAATIVAPHATPIDAALPLVVVIVMGVAALAHPSVALAVPLLLGGAVALAEERQRLLWYGIVVAAAFAAAIVSQQRRRSHEGIVLAVAAVLLLRWIPFADVLVGRELVILALTGVITALLRATPVAVAIAVATALFTTAVPLRTLALPLGVAVAAAVVRWAGVPPVRLPVVSAAALAAMLVFYPWSGALARALPVMLRGGVPPFERVPVGIALAAGTSAEVDVPESGRGLILSGANVPRLARGTVLGTVEPGGTVVRIGDVADWGVLRREHYYGRRNPLPRRPGGMIRGYGQTAWIDASGRVPVRPGRVTVTADPSLPPNAALQIDAIELGP